MGSTLSSPSEASSSANAGVQPAVIVVEPESAGLRVAALSTLDRLLVAAHRSGLAPLVVVCDQALPPVPRARAWNVPFTVVRHRDETPDHAIWLSTGVLVQPVDLKRLAGCARAQLVDAHGTRLSAVAGRRAAPGVGLFDAPEAGMRAELKAEGVACPVRDAEEAREASRRLWASIRSTADGTVDRWFNRPVGRPFSKLLVHTPVTPNQISVAATLLGVVAALLFGLGQHPWSIAGAVLFQVSAILDCMDGDVARVAFKESPLGKWLDLVGDQVVHLSVFVGIAAGAIRAGAGAEMGWLGALAVAGASMSFLMVVRSAKGPASSGRLQKLLDAATNRDFSVLVLALALADRLEWFLWMAAVGSHVFWLLVWGVQRREGLGVAARRD